MNYDYLLCRFGFAKKGKKKHRTSVNCKKNKEKKRKKECKESNSIINRGLSENDN